MTDETKRARRRRDYLRMKKRALRTMNLWQSADKHGVAWDLRDLGVNISTHCRRCNCWMCSYRKDVHPRRERAFYDLSA